ncbi:MAG: GNA1162 family protein [Pseudomonadota bacterium]
MIRRFQCVAVFFILTTIMTGCGFRTTPVSIPGYADKGIRLIAVMPVKAKTADPVLAKLMRERILEALYFKGYPRIPVGVIDDTLAKIYGKLPDHGADIPPQAVRSLLAVDAVLYVTLNECRTATTYLYAATIISADFDLRDGKTGETLWKTQPQKVERNFDITRQRLERTICQVLEPAIQEVVEKALQGLPDGPDAIK